MIGKQREQGKGDASAQKIAAKNLLATRGRTVAPTALSPDSY